MKILITGGAGFIGCHLAERLLKDGHEITIIDNFSRGVKDSILTGLENDPRVRLVTLDLMDKEAVLKLEKDFDRIYHLAAIIGVQNVLEHSYDVLDKNVTLLLNMIEFAKRQKDLKRFVFASTSEIYAGTLQFYDMKIPTPEDTPLTVMPLDNPRTSYMLSKIYGEALLYQSGLPFIVIRPHNFYGPRMGMSHVIPELLKKAYYVGDGEAIEVFSVEHKRTFCYISDAVEMIARLSENEEAVGRSFNIGNEEPEVSIERLAGFVLETVGKGQKIDPKPATLGSPARRCPDMKKTFGYISFRPEVSLEEGIKRTYEWYRENIFEGNEMGAK